MKEDKSECKESNAEAISVSQKKKKIGAGIMGMSEKETE